MNDRVWEEFSRTLRTSAPYKALLQGLGDVVRLPVPAAAWVGELLARDLGRQLLVVVPREADALAWIEAARLFGREEEVVYFPAPSLTPYQEAETSLLVRAQESSAIDRILSIPSPLSPALSPVPGERETTRQLRCIEVLLTRSRGA
jgi:hypothetical protein